MSGRTSKKKTVVSKLVQAILRIQKERSREWWKGIAEHPVDAVVKKLRNVPTELVETALNNLLNLPPSHVLINNKEVHAFLRRKSTWLSRTNQVTNPLFVAHIGHLVARGEYSDAAGLISRFPESDSSELGALVSYLRFVVNGPAEMDGMSGTASYSSLSPEDLFLGACYYQGAASAVLAEQSDWDYASITRSLRQKGGERDLSDFKVRGLHPRIAELVFSSVYSVLHGANAQNRLKDLNLEYVKKLTPPLTIVARQLPPADWEGENGEQYDVKCNVLYRSHQMREGLRGFLIKTSKEQVDSYPGFIFTGTDDHSCSWVYIGEYKPCAAIGRIGDRVLPFSFRLPDCARYTQSNNTDPRPGMDVLNDYWLRIGWQLATGIVESPAQCAPSEELLLGNSIQRCLNEMKATFLEYALWKALTETALDACCRYSRDSVKLFLTLATQLVSSDALPVRLPRIDGEPILARWITEVLKPLIENWWRIRCTKCGCSATSPGAIQIQITRMTSEGRIEGRMTCTRCNSVKDEVTLLTHCHCGHYPLIIGKNPVCSACGGLVCETCGSCKKDCGRRSTPDER
jgi:hypothetical protein